MGTWRLSVVIQRISCFIKGAAGFSRNFSLRIVSFAAHSLKEASTILRKTMVRARKSGSILVKKSYILRTLNGLFLGMQKGYNF